MHNTSNAGNTHNGRNKLASGRPSYCEECGDAYREISRLPGTVGLCPTCFQDVLNGDVSDAPG